MRPAATGHYATVFADIPSASLMIRCRGAQCIKKSRRRLAADQVCLAPASDPLDSRLKRGRFSSSHDFSMGRSDFANHIF